MKNILSFTFFLILFSACNDAPKKEIKIHHCSNNLDAYEIEQLPINKSYNDYSALFEVDFDKNINQLKGKIKVINEQSFKKSTKFDEETLTLTSEVENEYNEHNQLLFTKKKSITDDKEVYISQENKYNDDFKIISYGNFSFDYKYLYSYTYLESGLISSQKYKGDIHPKNLNDRKMENEPWSTIINYYYDNKNHRLKEISKSLNNIYNNDSCVVKYKYEDFLGKMPYQIIKYDKSGSRSSISNLRYDSIQNTLVIRSWKTFFTSFTESQDFSDKNLDSEIIITFDDNCKIKSVTEVSIYIKNMKKYAKAEYNEYGDLTYWSKFLYPKSRETDYDLTYLKEFDYKYQLENEGKYYEYTYDKIGNWVERKEGDVVVKRKIIYR
jgi:hypothetical protein